LPRPQGWGVFPESRVNAKPKPMPKPATQRRGAPGEADAKAKAGMHDKAGNGMKGCLKRQGMG
jgi:hypothetical protein